MDAHVASACGLLDKTAVRPFLALFLAGLAGVGCSNATDDGTSTNADNEIVEESTLEREIKPPVAAPETPIIGKDMSEVVTQLTAGMTAQAGEKLKGGCTLVRYKNAQGKVAAERETCEGSEIVHTVDGNGNVKTEYSDRNKDGKVDRFTGLDKSVVQYVDSNFDGTVDTIVEKVELIKDFSLKGYENGSEYSKSKFLFRIREDRNRDGKLDIERLIAKGPLTK
jgi:hypothetical protein